MRTRVSFPAYTYYDVGWIQDTERSGSMNRIAGACFVMALAAGLGLAQDGGKKIVNRKCPLKPDARVDTQQTLEYKGKIIGFCCSDCVDKWKANPAAHAAAVKEDAHLPE